jgi:two-component sensor histidine kinase
MMLEDLYRLLRSGHVQAQGIVDTLGQPLLVLDQSYRVLTANNAFVRTFAADRDEVVDRSLYSLGNGQWDIPELRTLLEAIVPKSAGVIGYEVSHDFPVLGKRTFLIDAQRLVHPDNNSTSILIQFEDVTERKRHDAEKDFVIAETQHRMKNLFSVVRAIAMQTEIENRTAEQYRDVFLGRVDVAMRAQEISFGVKHAQLSALIENTVEGSGSDRVEIVPGPPVELARSRVLPVSLMFHELSTNALKYGSLSVPDGTVKVHWRIDAPEGGKRMLICEWREENGPPCRPPEKLGYGTELIEGTTRHFGGSAKLDFDPNGLVAILTLPI